MRRSVVRAMRGLVGGAMAIGVVAIAAIGVGQDDDDDGADVTRLFDVDAGWPPSTSDVHVDFGGFTRPRDGARMVYLDTQGVLARGTLRDGSEAADCAYCGGMRGRGLLVFDAAPSREPVHDWDHHAHPVVVGPLDDAAPDPAIVLEPDDMEWSIDLDGDGRGDLATTYLARACPGPSHELAPGGEVAPCDLMRREVCDAQVRRGRHSRSWRPIERVERPYCAMDGRRDFEF